VAVPDFRQEISINDRVLMFCLPGEQPTVRMSIHFIKAASAAFQFQGS
jgi:hypothetical protein